MNTILYFKGKYIDCLDDLKQLFKGTIDDNLRRELLASFQDGVLIQWLKEGDEECIRLIEDLEQIDVSLSNQIHMDRLKGLFANEKTSTHKSSILKFEDHCQIDSITYCKLDNRNNPIGQPAKVNNGGIRFKNEENLSFQLYIGIKIINPDNERIPLRINVSDKEQSKYREDVSIDLNSKKNDIKYIPVTISLKEYSRKFHKLSIQYGQESIWNTQLILGTPFVNIVIDGKKVPFTYIDGGSKMKSFYLMKYVVVDSYNKPRTNTSYNQVQSYIKNIQNSNNILLRLPTVREWQFAARGGDARNTCIYAGSDEIDDVAWYYNNSSRGYYSWDKQPHIVGKKKANKFDLYDMFGNVWEMTEDVEGTRRLVCGGCFRSEAKECRADSTKTIGRSNDSTDEVGFRLICDTDVFDTIDESLIEYLEPKE